MVFLLFRPLKKMNITIELRKFSPSGGTIASVMHFLDGLKGTDLVIVDTSMGDQLGYRGNSDSNLWYRAYFGIMAIRSLKSAPAVMFSEIMPATVFFNWFRGHPDPCGMDVRTFGHWDAFTTLQVPAFSLVDFMCAALPRNESFYVTKGTAAFPRFWWPEASGRGPQHPSCDTHEIIAHAFAQHVLQAFTSACTPRLPAASAGGGGSPRLFSPVGQGLPSAHELNLTLTCIRSPLTNFEVNGAAPFALMAAQAKHQRLKDGEGSTTKVSGPFPATVVGHSWILAEDKRANPGWIALPNISGRIVFKVKAMLGRVSLGYLKTYKNIGAVTCRVGTGPEMRVDAQISGRYSVRDVFHLSWGAPPKEEAEDVEVSCRSEGAKFKIIWLKSC